MRGLLIQILIISSEVRGKVLKGGYITVVHTHGRNGQYHPHVHVLATSGGYDAEAKSWEHVTVQPIKPGLPWGRDVA